MDNSFVSPSELGYSSSLLISPEVADAFWYISSRVWFSPFLIPSRSWRIFSIQGLSHLFPVQVVDDSSVSNSPAECLYFPQSALDSPQVTTALNFVHASADYRLTPLQNRDVHPFRPLSRQTGSFRQIPRRSPSLLDRKSPCFPSEVIV